MKGRSRFRFRYRGIMGALAQSLSNLFDKILADEETAGNANVFYDPQDLTSLRVGRNGSGGQPVVGDPVGMMLDTSPTGSQTMEQFLESQPELVTNGTFDTDISGWTLGGTAGAGDSIQWNSGVLEVTRTTNNISAYQAISTTIGSSYKVVLGDVSDSFSRLGVGTSTAIPTDQLIGAGELIFVATATTHYVHLRSAAIATQTFDNISVKEIPGHHAIAPTDAARPILMDDPDTTWASLTDDGTRGEELLTNGSFDSASDWSVFGGAVFSGGSVTLTAATIVQEIVAEIGATYEITVEVSGGSANGLVRAGNTVGGLEALSSSTMPTPGTYTFEFTAQRIATFISLVSTSAFTVDNISVRKVNTAFDERGDELWNTPTISDPAVWQWDGSTLTGTGDGTADTAIGDPVVAGEWYEVSWTANRTSASGLAQVRVGLTFLETFGDGGTSTYIAQAAATNGLSFTDSGGWGGTITNITCKRVPYPNLLLAANGSDDDSTFDTDTGNWTKGTGWSIGSGVASCDGTNGTQLTQNLLTTNKRYRVRWYVSAHTAGNLRIVAGTYGDVVSITGIGWYEGYVFATGPAVGLRSASFTGSIDNVIIQEVPASIPRSYYLDTDGVDDWMEVTPTLNLGEQWWHTGGWQSDTDAKYAFGTSNAIQGGSRHVSGDWIWYDPSTVGQIICTSDPATKHVLTIEQSDTNSLSARYDGVTEADPITPYNDSGGTQGLVLFSSQNNTFNSGLDGRFYGGAWGQGQVDYDELTTLQDYLGTLLEPDIDPTDVTAYANVYDMLGAQTAAALFDINDKTSLRVETDGSGGVPVEGDPVGVMMDVSGTGGLTMEAYLQGATELVTNGTFDTDSDWVKQSGWAISGGQAVGTAVNGYLYPTSISLPVGTTMRLTFDAVVTSGIVSVRLGSFPTVILVVSASGSYSIVRTATVADDLSFQGTSFTGTIDNVSIKALPGYTAVAASDAARPTLKTYNSPISSREILTTTYSWNITDGGRA
jgi:hypothetical protein